MLAWLLQSFPNSDREIATVHTPLLLGYLLRWMNVSLYPLMLVSVRH
jgi:hypothetical protein